jgi:hypothetical protein
MSINLKEIPKEKLEFYDKLISTNPNIERKGNSMPYTSHNGHMFTYLTSEGSMGLRLPVKDREDFMKKYNTSLDRRYGAIMKEYVKVPDCLLKNTNELSKYLDINFKYVQSLKPKPTKKK